jgi:hypothetical protein
MNTQTVQIENSENKTETRVQAWIEKYNVTIKADFVPFSKSRNSEEKNPSLNWKITLERNGREFLRCDYMQGYGHAPAAKRYKREYEKQLATKRECETGREARITPSGTPFPGKPIPSPSVIDVLSCISSDASAIDSPTYEEWAVDLGYDADSRKGEAIYRQCVEHGLKLRAAVGDKGLQELREATQDW